MTRAASSPKSAAIDCPMLPASNTGSGPRSRHNRHDLAGCRATLAQVVANEIIPRLLRLHSQATTRGAGDASPDGARIRAMARLVLERDLDAAADYAMARRGNGLPLEMLFVTLLVPAARDLSALWEEDECSFVDVAQGISRLQELLALFHEPYRGPALDARRQALVATTLGQQHDIGDAGWQVRIDLSARSGQSPARPGASDLAWPD